MTQSMLNLQEAVTGNFTELSKLLANRGAKVSENGKVQHHILNNSLGLLVLRAQC